MSDFYFGPVTGYDDERREEDYTPLHLRDERYRLACRVWVAMKTNNFALVMARAFTAMFVQLQPTLTRLIEMIKEIEEDPFFQEYLEGQARRRTIHYRHWKPRGRP